MYEPGLFQETALIRWLPGDFTGSGTVLFLCISLVSVLRLQDHVVEMLNAHSCSCSQWKLSLENTMLNNHKKTGCMHLKLLTNFEYLCLSSQSVKSFINICVSLQHYYGKHHRKALEVILYSFSFREGLNSVR